jgi:hypothetical protein
LSTIASTSSFLRLDGFSSSSYADRELEEAAAAAAGPFVAAAAAAAVAFIGPSNRMSFPPTEAGTTDSALSFSPFSLSSSFLTASCSPFLFSSVSSQSMPISSALPSTPSSQSTKS